MKKVLLDIQTFKGSGKFYDEFKVTLHIGDNKHWFHLIYELNEYKKTASQKDMIWVCNENSEKPWGFPFLSKGLI